MPIREMLPIGNIGPRNLTRRLNEKTLTLYISYCYYLHMVERLLRGQVRYYSVSLWKCPDQIVLPAPISNDPAWLVPKL